MKAARAQDRRTIDLLRESSATGAADSGGAATADSSSAALTAATNSDKGTPDAKSSSGGGGGVYLASLEEQVKVLKETLREYGHQRDQMALEVARLKEAARTTILQQLEATTNATATATSGGGLSAGTATATAAAAAGDDGERHGGAALLLLRIQLEQTREELAASKSQVQELEHANDQLQQEAQKSNSLLLDAMTKLREDAVQRGSNAGGGGTLTDAAMNGASQYIRDLESELEKWRSAATAADDLRQWRSEAASIGNGAASVKARTARTDREASDEVSKLQSQLDAALARLREAAVVVDAQQEQLAALEARASVQEESLDHMYDETRQLRQRLEAAMTDAEAARCAAALGEAALDAKQRQVTELQFAVEEHEHLAAKSRATTVALTKELNAAREEIRLAKAAAAAAALVPGNSSSSRSISLDARNAEAVAVGIHSQPEQAAFPLSHNTTTEPQQPFSLRLSYAQIAGIQLQVKTAWEAITSRQRVLWTNQKLRLYYVTGLFLCLVVLFSFYQSTVIADGEHDCKELFYKEQLELCLARRPT
jgi:hypothetical protein